MVSKNSNIPVDKSSKEIDPEQRLSELLDENAALPSPDDLRELHEQIETLNKALKAEKEKADGHWERLLRKEAEMQNIQRRHDQELENARKMAIEPFASELLNVLDSLDQGISFSQNGQGSLEDLLKGMQLTQSVLVNALEKNGITLIDPQGEMFNPNFHEAISIQETTDMEPNRIVAVVQKGYMLHKRLLRPARVVVAKAPKS